MRRIIFLLTMLIGYAVSVMAADVPQYPGGEKALNEYIASTLKYPAAAKENGIEGVVNVSFTVNLDGTIGAIKIVRMVDPDLEQEAIRVVKGMPKWEPATKNGQPVAATATVAVPFTLE